MNYGIHRGVGIRTGCGVRDSVRSGRNARENSALDNTAWNRTLHCITQRGVKFFLLLLNISEKLGSMCYFFDFLLKIYWCAGKKKLLKISWQCLCNGKLRAPCCFHPKLGPLVPKLPLVPLVPQMLLVPLVPLMLPVLLVPLVLLLPPSLVSVVLLVPLMLLLVPMVPLVPLIPPVLLAPLGAPALTPWCPFDPLLICHAIPYPAPRPTNTSLLKCYTYTLITSILL